MHTAIKQKDCFDCSVVLRIELESDRMLKMKTSAQTVSSSINRWLHRLFGPNFPLGFLSQFQRLHSKVVEAKGIPFLHLVNKSRKKQNFHQCSKYSPGLDVKVTSTSYYT